jgi:hypothetical protein
MNRGRVTNFGSKPAKKVSSKTLQTSGQRYSQSGNRFFLLFIQMIKMFVDRRTELGTSLATIRLTNGENETNGIKRRAGAKQNTLSD